MAVKFGLFSKDIAATINPWTANPQPATFVDFGEEPLYGSYTAPRNAPARGSRIPTLGGAVYQDFGPMLADANIVLSVVDVPMLDTMVAKLLTAWETVETRWYFTDSEKCFDVYFARPDGCRIYKSAIWRARSQQVYSIELTLWVVAVPI